MQIKINNKIIGDGQPVFIVAELGINHNGKLSLAKKMIDAVKRAGADAIKIQSYIVDDIIKDNNLKYTYFSQGHKVTESQYKMFKRAELSRDQQKAIFDYAKKKKIMAFSTPQDNSFKAVDYLCDQLKMPIIKVGSDDLTYLEMLSYYARKKKPIIISTGMATLNEVNDAVKTIKQAGNKKIIILKCTSLYPTPPQEANLAQITTLKNNFSNCLIGFSDHTEGSTATVAAVTMGACLIEKHFTLNKNLPGSDHWFAADPDELSLLVKQVRKAEKMFGNPRLVLSKKEKKIKSIARRSIMAAGEIKKGENIKAGDLVCRKPGTGLSPKHLPKLIGRVAKRGYKEGQIFTKNDL